MTAFLVVLVLAMVGSIWLSSHRRRRAVERYHAEVYGAGPLTMSPERRRLVESNRPAPPGS